HYVMMGGTLVAFLAGLHHWWPKMFGKMYNELGANIAAIIIFVGFNVTFFPQFILGTQGMPRRYATYIPQYQPLHVLSTYGSYLLGIGLLLAALVLLHSLFRGRKAPDNPFGAATLEWKCCSPPTHHNFEVDPLMGSPYVYDNIAEDPDGGYYEVLPDFQRESAPTPSETHA
ncbi:MAG: cbb3-type cytochrome c oxidase subunit I, partial [Planctomycetales bacterium]|nr:cbb3-type cytochrome c oxidase subunit I [Planctomycetales bacterium]